MCERCRSTAASALAPAQGPVAASPGGSGAVGTVAAVGDASIDALLAGTKWGGARGQGAEVDFSFARYGSPWADDYGVGEPYDGFRSLNAAQQAAARKALQLWADVANVSFDEVAETASAVGDIRFGLSNAPATAWAYYPDRGYAEGGDVWLGAASHRNVTDYAPGTYTFHSLIHEIGHALGLKHPHDADGTGVQSTSDWQGVTVMSYRSYPGDAISGSYSNDFFPTLPMLWDIRAVQALYGANYATRAGNTTYSWGNGEQIFECIWDGGGRDRIDCANQSSAVTINLAPGSWSKIGPAYRWDDGTSSGATTQTLSIAYGVTIENAAGGRGNDMLTGNSAANLLEGNAGRDRLSGGNGNDTLDGGAGPDMLSGGNGADLFVFDDGDAGIGGGRDRIFDFNRTAGDRIDLRPIDADVTAAGDQVFTWKGGGALTGAGQLGYYRSGGSTVLRASIDGDAAAELEIQLGGNATPTSAWFYL